MIIVRRKQFFLCATELDMFYLTISISVTTRKELSMTIMFS